MQSEDARYLKRKIRSRSIDVHPTEKALVVNYELEAFILGDLGDPLLGDKKELQKIIRLKSLNEDTDCAAFAKEVVEKCTLIHPSKLEEVEQLIYYLQKRKDASLSTSGSTSAGEEASGSGNESPGSASLAEAASINRVDSYVELLYEGTADKVRGSALLLQLARNPDNLDELGANESVLSALSRVLREDWKKSVELSTNIVYIFFCFSTYSQFHHVILQYKIGSLCMEVIDHELKKFDQWKGDLDLRQRRLDESCPEQGPAAPESAGEPRKRASDGSVSHIPVAAAPKRKQGDARCSNEATDDARRTREELDKGRKKLLSYVKKQDQLLRVSFYLLLNIAEDTKVEDKMCRKNIVGLLTMTLDRDNVDLIILILTFLKKLSVFRENVNEMARLNVVEKMPRILKMNHSDLIHIALRLLLNLSFDTQLRDRMVRVGLLNKLVGFLGDEKHETIVLKILYHMSMDDRCKSMFSYTDCVPVAMRMLLKCPEDEVNLELLALCINLAVNKRNAQMMMENSQLRGLMERAFRNQDSLIMKMIRNVAQHDCTKNSFVEFVGDIAKAIVDCESEDFVVECLGVLGNMTLPELDFSQLFQRFNLVSWVLNALVPGKYEDDILLEVVVLLGTAALDEGCVSLLCKADVLLSLIELLKAKQEDDEMVLQIIYVFYAVSRHISTRDYIIKETEVPAYLIDLMHDKNLQIRKVCNLCLDIIAEWNKEWSERIKLEKFRWHNSQWLEMVEGSAADPVAFDHAGSPDREGPPYPDDDIVQRTLLFSAGSHLALNESEDSLMNNKDNLTEPRSRYSSDLEGRRGLSPSSNSSSSSSEDLARSGLGNLRLRPVSAAQLKNVT
ncbi:kinesin-associated protein 3 isoform X2 [Bacillus rossius redtenbacheri]|uniref:kinesin-associated protein 3 isoform X2 n=1 Tax=Bacillus rossius redtenbacheri TaxID=93214 RepID=UPI002FDEE301